MPYAEKRHGVGKAGAGLRGMILDRYIVRMWAGPFFGGLALVLGVLLLSRALRLMDMATDVAGVWAFLFRLLTLTVPYFLLLAAPIAFFLALQSVLVGLQERSEMDALRAAGVSHVRMLRGMFVMAALLWAALTWVSMQWLPASQLEFGNLLRQIYAMKGASAGLTPHRFADGLEGLTIYVDGEVEGGRYRGVVIDDRRSAVPVIYLAREAVFESNPGRLGIRLHDGVRLEGSGADQRMLAFESYQVALPVKAGAWRAWQVTENAALMPPSVLWQQVRARDVKAVIELNRRLILPATVLLLMFLALPLSLVRKRSGKAGAFVLGISALVVVYNVQLALHRLALDGKLPPYGMWIAFAAMLAFALLFWLLASRDRLPAWLTGMGDGLARVLSRVSRRISKRQDVMISLPGDRGTGTQG